MRASSDFVSGDTVRSHCLCGIPPGIPTPRLPLAPCIRLTSPPTHGRHQSPPPSTRAPSRSAPAAPFEAPVCSRSPRCANRTVIRTANHNPNTRQKRFQSQSSPNLAGLEHRQAQVHPSRGTIHRASATRASPPPVRLANPSVYPTVYTLQSNITSYLGLDGDSATPPVPPSPREEGRPEAASPKKEAPTMETGRAERQTQVMTHGLPHGPGRGNRSRPQLQQERGANAPPSEVAVCPDPSNNNAARSSRACEPPNAPS